MNIYDTNRLGAGVAIGRYRTDEEKWQAVIARDKQADGVFYFAVATTGVYCRPCCGARRARRENVSFYETQAAAEQSGFRPCKRCRPDHAPSWIRKAELAEKACRFIEAAETPPTLKQVATEVGLSAYHFHRLFKEVTGLTPKAYATSHRARRVKDSLVEQATVTDAIYEAGYGASSRFYEKAPAFLGMTPQQFRRGGPGQTIRYAVRPCALGLMLLAATEKGVCGIALGDDAVTLEQTLRKQFPQASLALGDAPFDAWVDAALTLIETGEPATDLPLDIRGTVFQHKVWSALQTIPRGATLSYKEVAARIGAPNSARAVARACAGNPVAVAIPCHRVVRSDGALGGYRWGIARKRTLLARERERG